MSRALRLLLAACGLAVLVGLVVAESLREEGRSPPAAVGREDAPLEMADAGAFVEPSVVPARRRTMDVAGAARRWLAAQQSPDGAWRGDGGETSRSAVELTGLAVQAFLGTGISMRSHSVQSEAVRRGLVWLQGAQDEGGGFGSRTSPRFLHGHAIATLALVESWEPSLREAAQRGLDLLAVERGEEGVWGTPADDVMATAWAFLALRSAVLVSERETRRERPAPFAVDMAAFEATARWIDDRTDPASARVGPWAEDGEVETALGVVVRCFVDPDAVRSDLVERGIALCAARPPRWNPEVGAVDLAYALLGSIACTRTGGPDSATWRHSLSRVLRQGQRHGGPPLALEGSWDPAASEPSRCGRLRTTALALRMLVPTWRVSMLYGYREN